MRGVFVTGTDTDAGKTVLAAALMAATGPRVRYWKALQTGIDVEDETAEVRRAAGLPPERVLDEGVRLPIPASPHYAARRAGTRIDAEELAARGRRADGPDTRWVVEGAGGLLVPLSEDTLQTALMRALGMPLVVAASTRVGTINHTLLTLRQAAAEGLEVLGVVLLGEAEEGGRSGLAAHADAPILGRVPWLERLEPEPLRDAGQALLEASPMLARALAPDAEERR